MSQNNAMISNNQDAPHDLVIRMWRQAGGLSIGWLGRRIHIDHAMLARIEHSELINPSSAPLNGIAQKLGMTPEVLLRCLGVRSALPDPEEYLRGFFGLNDNQIKAAIRFIWELADLHEEQT